MEQGEYSETPLAAKMTLRDAMETGAGSQGFLTLGSVTMARAL